MVQKCHPDKHNNSPESQAQFVMIHNAYSVLADSQKRREYDLYIKTSSTFKTRMQGDLNAAALPGRPGDIYRSNEELLAHLNYLLWDIEDLIRDDKSILREKPGGDDSPQFYVLRVLAFIDKWILEQAGYGDHFMEARQLQKRDPSEYIHSIGKPGQGHQPFTNMKYYFYNIRVRIDKFLSMVTARELVAKIKGHDMMLLDCIIEAQNYTVHFVSYLFQLQKQEMPAIPPFAHSNPCFTE